MTIIFYKIIKDVGMALKGQRHVKAVVIQWSIKHGPYMQEC